MAVVKTLNIGNATIRFHDDYIKSREESEEIMQRATENALRKLYAQERNKLAKGIQLSEDNI